MRDEPAARLLDRHPLRRQRPRHLDHLPELAFGLGAAQPDRGSGAELGTERAPDLASADPELPVPSLLAAARRAREERPGSVGAPAFHLRRSERSDDKSVVQVQAFDTHRERLGAPSFAPGTDGSTAWIARKTGGR
jgi:hypothetical protein